MLKFIFLFFSIFALEIKALSLMFFSVALYYFYCRFNFFVDNFIKSSNIVSFYVTKSLFCFIGFVSFLAEQLSTFLLAFITSLKIFFIFGFNPSIFFSSRFPTNSLESEAYSELTQPLLDYAFSSFFSYTKVFFSLASIFFEGLLHFFIFNLLFLLLFHIIISFFMIFVDSNYGEDFLIKFFDMSLKKFILYIILSFIIVILLYISVDSIKFCMS